MSAPVLRAAVVADAAAMAAGMVGGLDGVATGQARARRFYAREGRREAGAPSPEASLGLELVEMRRPGASSPDPGLAPCDP